MRFNIEMWFLVEASDNNRCYSCVSFGRGDSKYGTYVSYSRHLWVSRTRDGLISDIGYSPYDTGILLRAYMIETVTL